MRVWYAERKQRGREQESSRSVCVRVESHMRHSELREIRRWCRQVMQQLHHLLVLSDDLRKQQMLLKFFLQLKTFSCDNVVRTALLKTCNLVPRHDWNYM
jgi:hypothetical protein